MMAGQGAETLHRTYDSLTSKIRRSCGILRNVDPFLSQRSKKAV